MSELSKIFVQNGWNVTTEIETDRNMFRLYVAKYNDTLAVDFIPDTTALLSVDDFPGWEMVLSAGRKICTQFIQSEPICSYDTEVDDHTFHFMEWETEIPENRLREVVNQSDQVSDQAIYCNLELYGNYRLEDYVDPELQRIYQEAEVARQQYPGVYGKDPSLCDVAHIAQADEFGLFLEYCMAYYGIAELQEICSLRNLGSTTDYSEELKDFSQAQMEALLLALDYIVYNICQKAGIDVLEEPSDEYRLIVDYTSLLQWVLFYSAHVACICPDDDSKEELLTKYQLGEDVSSYAPTGNWRDFRY